MERNRRKRDVLEEMYVFRYGDMRTKCPITYPEVTTDKIGMRINPRLKPMGLIQIQTDNHETHTHHPAGSTVAGNRNDYLSAKKRIPMERYEKNIMRIVKSNRFIIPHMNMSSCTSLSRKSREILTSIFKQW